MTSWWQWALVSVVAFLALVPIIVHESRLYRRGSTRGTLRFDTPEARAALRDPDDWFAE